MSIKSPSNFESSRNFSLNSNYTSQGYLLKATLFTDAVTTILLECLLAAILAARSIRASNSPPKIIQRFVSVGNTKSVNVVRGFRMFWSHLYVNEVMHEKNVHKDTDNFLIT
jgi:hypothetical protein